MVYHFWNGHYWKENRNYQPQDNDNGHFQVITIIKPPFLMVYHGLLALLCGDSHGNLRLWLGCTVCLHGFREVGRLGRGKMQGMYQPKWWLHQTGQISPWIMRISWVSGIFVWGQIRVNTLGWWNFQIIFRQSIIASFGFDKIWGTIQTMPRLKNGGKFNQRTGMETRHSIFEQTRLDVRDVLSLLCSVG